MSTTQTTQKAEAHSAEQSARTKRDTKAINALAREWAEYVGGFGQAQKVVGEAYDLGMRNSGASELLKELKTATNIIAELIDAHYGAAYHHIGDGDGLDGHDVDTILDWIENKRGDVATSKAEKGAQ